MSPCVALHVRPPHHIAEELARSQVPDLHTQPRSSVESEAVHAGVQLFHLFTQESLMLSGPRAQKSDVFHAPTLSRTAAAWPRCELFNGFTLCDDKFPGNKKSFAKGIVLWLCVCVCPSMCSHSYWMNRCVISSSWEHERNQICFYRCSNKEYLIIT